MASGTEFLVGTASWTDPSLVKSDLFYPPSLKTAEERLRFYAEQFKTVEVDASYYTIISERTAELWVERTPPDFIFSFKAFALMTRHAADTARLPAPIKNLLSAEEKTARRLTHPSPAVRELAFQMFGSSLEPLRAAGKLGTVVFQFPPYFVRSETNLKYMADLKRLLPNSPIAIEFRHPSWVADRTRREATMSFLSSHDLCYVSVDEPEAPSLMPSFLETTGPEAYIRMHGKNLENWFKKGITVAERYQYLYSERELADWADRMKQLRGVKRAHVIFNNCYRNFGVMNATTMRQMLG
ncbi:MAG TPA: DUF72 domain-containing protein [Candidatus Binataceae bacterium]|nr:DUF72 domain-containing protein [Candidatus Binataceae bacterium]